MTAILLIESYPRANHGNFLWGSAVGMLLALPLFLSMVARAPRSVRALAGMALAFHMYAAAVHIYRFIRFQTLL